MGKNQHSKDGLHLRPTEWAQDGRGFKSRGWTPYSTLPLHCCALSLQPFESPVGTASGSVFEGKFVTKYIKRYGKHPVTGSRLEVGELVPLHFHKNTDGKFQCPVTFKVFTNHSHVVMSMASGHVYSFDAVDQLNRKTKNWLDLITSQKFKWSDIVTIQDPDNIEFREIAKFHFMQQGQQEEVVANITHRESKIAREQMVDNVRKSAAMERIWDEKKKLADEKKNEEAKQICDATEPGEDKQAEDAPLQIVKKTHERYSSGAMAESFTSTMRSVTTQNELRMQTEQEALVELYDAVRKLKSKAYVRIITSEGMLNLELHADIVPRTTDNFLRLCEAGYYDGTVFHRLIHNFMLQGGDPTGTGRGGKSGFEDGAPFKDEIDSRLTHSGPGILSMANSGKNTNKSQFFVTMKSCQHLDLKHSVFGRVVGGLQLLEAFNEWEVDEKDRPLKPITLLRAEVFKNPFKEVLEEAARPKVEVVADPVATWFSNRRDPMCEHRNRNSGEVGKYLNEGAPGSGFKPLPAPAAGRGAAGAPAATPDLPSEEMEYASATRKAKMARTSFDFSSW